MDVSLEVEIRQALATLGRVPTQVERALRGGMEDSTSYLERQLTTYPPKRPGSGYVRTDTLRGSWDTRIEGRGLEIVGTVFSNGNVAPYNRLVQDRTRQARVHRGRWTNTAQEVSERSRGQINDMFASRIRAAIG